MFAQSFSFANKLNFLECDWQVVRYYCEYLKTSFKGFYFHNFLNFKKLFSINPSLKCPSPKMKRNNTSQAKKTSWINLFHFAKRPSRSLLDGSRVIHADPRPNRKQTLLLLEVALPDVSWFSINFSTPQYRRTSADRSHIDVSMSCPKLFAPLRFQYVTLNSLDVWWRWSFARMPSDNAITMRVKLVTFIQLIFIYFCFTFSSHFPLN